MARCIVVADDLTGANATGVLLKKNGFDTRTLLRAALDRAASIGDCDCLVYPTDSRAVGPEEAYARVREALGVLSGPEVRFYAKRIDSTLRGNLGSETDAFLDALGEDSVAVCVPCFPGSGRVIAGSHLLVNGVPLRKTEAAADPKCPIRTSDALALFQSQTKYRVAPIHLDDVHDGPEHLAKVILGRKEAGFRVLLADSVTDDDLRIVAEAAAASGIKAVSVDPGPFTACLAKKLIPGGTVRSGKKIFCAIGSVNGVARAQTRALLNRRRVAAVYLDAAAILESDEIRATEIGRLTGELIRRRDEADILAVIGSGIDPDKQISFAPYAKRLGTDIEGVSSLVNDAFARVTMGVVAACPEIGGIYSTGGDITAAIHAAAGTAGLRLVDEVLPLAGYGVAIGGNLAGKAFVSKGGMVGGEDAMVACADYLLARL